MQAIGRRRLCRAGGRAPKQAPLVGGRGCAPISMGKEKTAVPLEGRTEEVGMAVAALVAVEMAEEAATEAHSPATPSRVGGSQSQRQSARYRPRR